MAKIKKYQDGGKSSLGMKSVIAKRDKNPGITRTDIILAAKKQAKSGAKVKKAQDGEKLKVSLRADQLKRLGRLSAKNPEKAEKVGKRFVERATRKQRGIDYLKKNAPSLKPSSTKSSVEMKKGGKVKKAQSGGSMKKCRGGCY